MSSAKSPIILGFEPGESLSSLNSIIVGVGWSWGTVTMPFTPLEFTPERIAKALGPGSGYLNGHLHLTNQAFYENTYTNLPLVEKKKFWGTKNSVTKQVRGLAFGISGGGLLKEAAEAVVEGVAKLGLQVIIRKIIEKHLKAVSLDALQSSTSGDATLYGLNGNDTYNLYMVDFNKETNIFFINAGISAIAAASLNLAFVGYFPTMPSTMPLQDLPDYLWDCANKAIAFTVVNDAALGLIMPGGTISIISS
ncbi:hypothetical protein BH09BAC4_BH09BAC4_22170 [soil metagenome]